MIIPPALITVDEEGFAFVGDMCIGKYYIDGYAVCIEPIRKQVFVDIDSICKNENYTQTKIQNP